MSAEEIKALSRQWVEESNKGKAAALAFIEESWAADVVMHSAFGENRGLENGKRLLSGTYDAFPDIHFTLDDVIVEGDKAVLRYTFTCTHKGVLMGIPPTNKKITGWELEIDRFEGGKLVEYWSRFDTLGFMQQLGVIPTPKK